jgi:hypothetical protein
VTSASRPAAWTTGQRENRELATIMEHGFLKFLTTRDEVTENWLLKTGYWKLLETGD